MVLSYSKIGKSSQNIYYLYFTKNLLIMQQKFYFFAAVVELADALDSKSSGSDTVSVRPRPAAPKINNLR